MRRTVALLTAAAAALAVVAVPAAAQADVSVSVDPSRVAPGGTVEVTGSCGPAVTGQDVQVVLGGGIEGGQLARVTTDASTGGFATTVTIPEDAPTGSGTVAVACGLGSADDPTAELTITRAAQADPDVYAFGGAPFVGSTGELELAASVVDLAGTPTGGGYWEVATDGGVFAYGDAGFHGSAGGIDLAAPIVAVAPTPDGGGYWLFAADGGVFAFGDARFHGSLGGVELVAPVVDAVATPTGEGYWMVAADGGVFALGDATFRGSAADLPLVAPVTAIGTPADGGGYWLAATDGGIFAYGGIPFHGSAGGIVLNQPIVDLAVDADGGGYWLAGRDGGVFSFGDADFHGSLGAEALNEDVVAIAAREGGGYWMATTGVSGERPVGRPSTAPKQSEGWPTVAGPVALLEDIRIAGHQGFDRVVFQFRNAVPAWLVGYVQPPIRQDGSGNEVEVDGEAFLGVTMQPASGVDLSGPEFDEVYTGPDRIDPPQVSVVDELVRTGDFEAVLSWVAGLDQRVPFGVTTLDSPPRLVIDLVTSR